MTIPVTDPCTGAVEFALAEPAPATLRAATRDLRAAQPAWEAAGPGQRADVLLRWRDALLAAGEPTVAALTRDTGRRPGSELELDQVVRKLEHWAERAPRLLAPGPDLPTALPGLRVVEGARAYPVVGVISPWNYPLMLGLIDAVPALAAGSAVLVKPSEVTPRFVEPLVATLPPELPLRVVAGGGATGAAVVDLVDLVVFTGSVPTGRTVAQAAARAMIPCFLELGGKDPAIVLAGADTDRATSAILWGGTVGTGQSCLSIERVYVERSVHDAFVDLLVAKAGKVGLTVDGGHLGPVIDPAQVAVVERHLADAAARGAVVRCGGEVERRSGGAYLRPTVLTGVDHSMLVMTEETFAPVLPVMAVDDAATAVALANDSAYGLSGAVFGPDEATALAVARRLDVGAVSVNDAALTSLVHDGAKNSFKLSGLGGSRMGDASIRRFLRRQAFLVNTRTEPDPWWYPELQEG